MKRSPSKENNIIRRHRRSHVFGVFRRRLRFQIAPLFLGFTAIDYLHVPDFWIEGAVLRLLWTVLVFAGFELLKRRSIREHHFETIPMGILIGACWVVDWMLFRSGGYSSLYLTGLILVNVTGLEMIKFPRKQAIIVNLLSYFPAGVVVWFTAGVENWRIALIQFAFLGGMTALAWVYRSSGDSEIENWASRQARNQRELVDMRKTEVLKKQFPAFIRQTVESGNPDILKKRILSMAVVGFADMCSSTKLANETSLMKDWSLKEEFLEAAIKRATENNLIVLSQQGDGCFFLANFQGGDSWPLNIIAFFENLLSDFQRIKTKLNLIESGTGIKFGITMGPAVVGFIGKDQSYFTANGPDVNLAARLCSEAGPDELLIGSRVWYVLKHHLVGWEIEEKSLTGLKGFTGAVPVVRIRPRLKRGGSRPVCAICQSVLLVVSTADGMLDIRCEQGHSGDQVHAPATEKAA